METGPAKIQVYRWKRRQNMCKRKAGMDMGTRQGQRSRWGQRGPEEECEAGKEMEKGERRGLDGSRGNDGERETEETKHGQ